MPDISGLPALDVAIGLIFVYFVFSLIASGINEAIASVFALRARSLEEGLRSMLAEPGKGSKALDAIADHRLISSLVKTYPSDRKWRPWRRKWPSYLPARTFATVLLDTLAPPVKGAKGKEPGGAEQESDAEQGKGVDHIARLVAKLDATDWREKAVTEKGGGEDRGKAATEGPFDSLPTDAKIALTTLLADTGADIENARKAVEDWFDDTMDRVGGWYKRRIQIILISISILIAGACNVDSFQIANSLLNDQTLRNAVVSQAQETAKGGEASGTASEKLDRAAASVTNLRAVKLPLGWKGRPPAASANAGKPVTQTPADPRWVPSSPDGWAGKLGGLLVTALALSLGAPFWFDLLNRVTRLRGTGLPEGGPRSRRARADAPEP